MRVAVVGSSASGKSTLSVAIAFRLGLPPIKLDAINWQEDWQSLADTDPDEFVSRVAAATAGPHWVVDGDYENVRRLVWGRATHLVWLDYSRRTILSRLLKRSLTRTVTRRPFWAGNRDALRSWFRQYHPVWRAWATWDRRRAEFASLLESDAFAHLTVLRLRHPGEAPSAIDRLQQDA